MESRKRRASSELQLDPTFGDLPSELLINIFNYLDNKNLLKLTLMSKRFNEIISDEFIDKLSVWFSNDKSASKWIGSRNYTNIHFKYIEHKNYFQFATFIEMPEKVKIISFQNHSNCYVVDPVIFYSLLRIFTNLEVINLPCDNSTANNISMIPNLTLKQLTIPEYVGNILRNLQSFSLEEISVGWIRNVS